jgi:hypothetical protein
MESRAVSYLYLSDFLGGKKVLITKYSPPRPQHLAEGLLEHDVIGGLIDWYQ